MSNIIQLLEKIGQEATLQNSNALAQAIKEAELPAELENTLLKQDSVALERQLDICPDIIAFLAPAKDDEPSDEETPEDTGNSTDIKQAVNV
ncbi:hypothetical protein [Thalassomonas haliotis]|uniref:Uncharacterized protein n=1 Tax=Thalassomonas haliotis TaxID=485448 RepID=A0ABY7VKV6_9GAMM|nr:hypothetical protein [Thalassomonas haliotis]WDE13854.1 hypothetical protein H3N35_10675 [Thalassomonas haliotis]